MLAARHLAILLTFLISASAFWSMTWNVRGVSPPTAAFAYEPCDLCLVPGDLVFFNANWSIGPSGSIALYTWDFGDPGPLVETTSPWISHSYFDSSGKWLVSLTVQDSNRLTDKVSQWVFFDVIPRFTFQPKNPPAGESVMFDASSSSSVSTVKGSSWSFGDGGSGVGTLVTHAYSAPGVYRVVLTLSTADGNPSISKTLSVNLKGLLAVQTTFDGKIVTMSGSFTVDVIAKSFAASATVSAADSTSGEPLLSKTFSVSKSFGSAENVKFVLEVSVLPVRLAVSCTVNVTVASANCLVSRTPDINESGVVDIVDVAFIAVGFDSKQGSSKYNTQADLDAKGSIDIVDIAIIASYYDQQVLK